MPYIDYFCLACGNASGDFDFMAEPCKTCGCPDKTTRSSGGFKMPAESSPAYQQWFHSDSTQAKLKSGEYTIMPKSADMNHR